MTLFSSLLLLPFTWPLLILLLILSCSLLLIVLLLLFVLLMEECFAESVAGLASAGMLLILELELHRESEFSLVWNARKRNRNFNVLAQSNSPTAHQLIITCLAEFSILSIKLFTDSRESCRWIADFCCRRTAISCCTVVMSDCDWVSFVVITGKPPKSVPLERSIV